MIEKILKILTNKKGRIEGQRISKKYFEKRKLYKELEFLQKNNIKCTQDLYNFVYNTTDKCSIENCNSKRRFISFKDGYKDYCEYHSRRLNNSARTKKSDYTPKPDKDFIKRKELKEFLKLLKENNKFISNRTRYPQINKYRTNFYEDILDSTFYLPKNCKFNERLYHIEHDLTDTVKCKKCGGVLDTFFSTVKGYRSEYCTKNSCAMEIANIKKSHPSTKMLEYHYYNHKKFYEAQNSEDYIVVFPSFEEYLKNRDNTVIKYTHTKCNRSYEHNLVYQGKYECPFCYPVRSKQQFLIYDFIKNLDTNLDISFNNRKILDGKEIDIIVDALGIEYDGQIFHSFGKSTDSRFNNYKLEKTEKYKDLKKLELCESKGIQLFRIFSSEWLGDKSKIWKSMISNKLGFSNRIYARKTIVKQVDSKIAKEFLENNHLQGSINSSIRIGLFYNDELVQIMTFGRPRIKKWRDKDYIELYRMCAKLNTTVVGGASKLFKYFERNFKCSGVISYANRRWSNGNVYKKLGFEFLYNSKPNYFYIKGNSYDANKLESRNKYQKHKLKDLLYNFDEKLTETENMFNNKYRKIYDCGNMVFIYLKEK